MNNAGKNMHNDLYLKWAWNQTDAFADACGVDGIDDDVILDLIDDKNDEIPLGKIQQTLKPVLEHW